MFYPFFSFFGLIEIVVIIYLIIKVANLSGNVKRMRRDIENLSSGKSGVKPSTQASPQIQPAPASYLTPAQNAFAPRQSSSAPSDNAFTNWLKENWLLKVGVLMILVGFGWFISYAFVHNWIGPLGRVALGFTVGSILALVGTLRLNKDDIAGTMLLILGSAIVVITSYAAQVVYDFFPPTVALAIPFIVSVCVTLIGMAYNKSKIAVYAVIIGLLAPMLTHAPQSNLNVLYMYLAVVALGSVWVAGAKNWREINVISLLGTLFYTAPHILSFNALGFQENYFVLGVIFALALLYFVVSVVGIVRSKQDTGQADVVVSILNAVLIIGTTMTFVPVEMRSLTLAAWMLLFAFGSFFVFSKTGKEKFFYIYSLIAVALLAVATSAELDGETLVIAFAFESAVVSIASYIITKSRDIGYRMSAFMLGPALMALPSFSSYSWQSAVLNSHFFVILTVGALLMFIGIFYYLLRNEPFPGSDGETPKVYVAHLITGSFYLFGLLWVSLHSALQDDSVAIISAMVIYTIVGISSYFKGVFASNKTFKGYGSAILLLVIARLVFVDVWSMPLAPRIVTFVVIGILFISTAFITKKKKVV